MNKSSFYRKVTYITAVAMLLMPLAYLSQPLTGSGKSKQTGKLADLQREYRLSPAQLGDIDPGSESMKLALFGLHGIAAHLLWEQAHHQKKVKNWDKLEATVKQIVRLQPNFKSVWDFQAHNLSYNVSVEFDNYEHRYLWVKKGIEFLIEGTHYNREEPIMFWNLGWYTGQKIGRSDEKIQFRKLYRDDKPFHDLFRQNGVDVDQAPGADGKPDNWFTARMWFEKGQLAAEQSGRPIRGKSPLIFHNQPAMSLINGSDAMEKEKYEGEIEKGKWDKAQKMWSTAGVEYAAYGNRPIPTSWGHNVSLGLLESIREQIAEKEKQLAALVPGAEERLKSQAIETLSKENQAIWNKATEDRTAEEQRIAKSISEQLQISPYAIADEAAAADRPTARLIADQIIEDQQIAQHTASYRGIINFDYWTQRCNAEQTTTAIEAHKHLLAAEEAFRRTDLTEAKEQYEASFKYYREIFNKYPLLMDNAESQDLVDSISRYNDVLSQLDEELPSDFILNDLLGMFDEGLRLLAIQKKVSPKAAEEAKPSAEQKPEEKPAEEKPAADKPADEKPAVVDKPAAPENKPAESEDKLTPTDTPASEDKPAPAEKPAAEPQTEPAATDKPEPEPAKPDSPATESEPKPEITPEKEPE